MNVRLLQPGQLVTTQDEASPPAERATPVTSTAPH